jgi:MFS family permease
MVNIICRFFEGIGDSWVQTACYSLITLKFPENREKFIGISEAASGIGLMAGPGIAGIFYLYISWLFLCFYNVCHHGTDISYTMLYLRSKFNQQFSCSI